MSDKSYLKRFDIFRKMPKDLTEPTCCGALGKFPILAIFYHICCTVSVICTFILLGLTIFEVQNYMKNES